MSFIKRELDRISVALSDPCAPDYEQLYAAQQALAWALEPTGYKSPYDAIRGTREDSADCPLLSCPLPSLSNPERDASR